MLYTRSSFLTYLNKVKGCDIKPHSNGKVITIHNGPVKMHIGVDKDNLIDYEEIFAICQRLYIDGLPGNSELELVE